MGVLRPRFSRSGAAMMAVLSGCGCSSDGARRAADAGSGGSALDSGAEPDGAGAASSSDAMVTAPPDASDASDAPGEGPCELRVVQPLASDGAIVVERIAYVSSGLEIYGVTCRPAGDGPFPLLLYNHGGVEGLGAGDEELCRNFAQNAGYAVFMSEYRGEGGSEGAIEGCLGEVDDVMRLQACAAERADVDANRAVMLGASHGGCITTRAVQRGAPVRAAVDIFGPTDFAAEHAFWTAARPAATGILYEAYTELITLFETVTGGTPDDAPEAYARRSPVTFASDLSAFEGDFLAVHGTLDALVPPSQSCALAAASGGFSAYHVDEAGLLVASPPAGCEADGLTWAASSLPSVAWPGSRYLIVYDGAGHDLDATVPAQARMVDAIVRFLVAKNP